MGFWTWPWLVSGRQYRDRTERLEAARDAVQRQKEQLREYLRQETRMHQNERHELFEAAKKVVDLWEAIHDTEPGTLSEAISALKVFTHPDPDSVLDADSTKPEPILHPEPIAHIKGINREGKPIIEFTPIPIEAPFKVADYEERLIMTKDVEPSKSFESLDRMIVEGRGREEVIPDDDGWEGAASPPAAGPETKVPTVVLEMNEDGKLKASKERVGGIDDA